MKAMLWTFALLLCIYLLKPRRKRVQLDAALTYMKRFVLKVRFRSDDIDAD